MAVEQDPTRWIRQAEFDMEAAEANCAATRFEWACFCCQQAAEKALKAVLFGQGRTTGVTTHSVGDLVKACQRVDQSFAKLAVPAKKLDRHYAQTRYPDAVNGKEIPGELYDVQDYEECKRFAASILTACRNWLGGSSGSSRE
jgi:HEPN domain-containing protein